MTDFSKLLAAPLRKSSSLPLKLSLLGLTILITVGFVSALTYKVDEALELQAETTNCLMPMSSIYPPEFICLKLSGKINELAMLSAGQKVLIREPLNKNKNSHALNASVDWIQDANIRLKLNEPKREFDFIWPAFTKVELEVFTKKISVFEKLKSSQF